MAFRAPLALLSQPDLTRSVADLAAGKAKVQQALKESFAHFASAILVLGGSDADKPQKMFNREITLRGPFTMIDRQGGERLRQSIGYARIQGWCHPWTAAFQHQPQKPAA